MAPEKSFFMLLIVKILGHEIGYHTIKPIRSKLAAIHKFPSPTGKVALMSFSGALNFYTKFIEKLHLNLKPFYDLLHENTPWKWTDEHEHFFQKLQMSLTSETELTIPNTKHPIFITVDASLIGLGAVLFQLNEQNKLKDISYNSRILYHKIKIFLHSTVIFLVWYTLFKFTSFLLLVLHIQYIFY